MTIAQVKEREDLEEEVGGLEWGGIFSVVTAQLAAAVAAGFDAK